MRWYSARFAAAAQEPQSLIGDGEAGIGSETLGRAAELWCSLCRQRRLPTRPAHWIAGDRTIQSPCRRAGTLATVTFHAA